MSLLSQLIKTDRMEPRPDTPIPPTMDIPLLIRIPTPPSALEAAESLIALSQSALCRDCGVVGPHVTHASVGCPSCPGCLDSVCAQCFAGARYFCPRRGMKVLSPPSSPLVRQEGVQTSAGEDTRENTDQ